MIHISKSMFEKKIGIFLFLFFALTVDFRTSIFNNVYIAYAFAAISIILLFRGTRTVPSMQIPLPIALWIISIVFVITSGDLSYITKYIIGLMLMYCYSKTFGAGGYTIKALAVFGIIFTAFTFVFYFYPDLYIDNIVPYLADYLKSTAVMMIRTNRYPGLTGHYSTNGIYLAFGLGALVSLYFSNSIKSKNNGNKIIIILIAITIGALLLIGKRAHLVFSIAACFVIYWMSNTKNKNSRLIKLLGIIIIASVVFVIAVNQIPALSNTFDRFSATAESGDFMMSRGTFYAVTWAQFLKNPLFGCGWRTMMDILEHDVHNVYLQLLAETGIVGFVCFAGLITYGVIIAVKVFRWAVKNSPQLSRDDFAMLIFSVYYFIFFTLYGMTGNPLYDEQPFYVFMVSYGAVLYYHRKIKLRTFDVIE